MNHLSEEQLVLYHYNDADRGEAAAIEEHLHACATCQADLDVIRRTVHMVDTLPVPKRDDDYGAKVWGRLEPRLASPAAPWWLAVQEFFASRRLVLAGAVAVLVVAAFVAGRFLPRSRPDTPAPVMATNPTAGSTQTGADEQRVRERILLVAVGDHLDRSQMTLTEMLNSREGPEVDISADQRRARDLVSTTRLYRQTALTTDDQGVAGVLDDLERVLVEIANSPSTMSAAEFRKVRERIERQGIVFKIRVFGEHVHERESRSMNDARLSG